MRFAGSYKKFLVYYLKSGFLFVTFGGCWMLYDGTSVDLSAIGRPGWWWNSVALAIIYVSFRIPYDTYKVKCIQKDFDEYRNKLKKNISELDAYYQKDGDNKDGNVVNEIPLEILSGLKSNEEEMDQVSSHYFGPYDPNRFSKKKRQSMNEIEIPQEARNKGI